MQAFLYSLLVFAGKATYLLQDKVAVQGEEFHAYLGWCRQPRLFQAADGCIKRPVGIFRAGDHGKDAIFCMIIKGLGVRQD